MDRSSSNLLTQGQHPSLGNFFHVLLPDLESGVTHLLAIVGNKATLYKVLSDGSAVSQDLDIPMLKTVFDAVNSYIG